MAEKDESSVLFSLNELMNIEEDRIADEEAEKPKTPRGDWLSTWCPRQDSNLRTRFRRPVLYPLSYGGFRTKW